MPGSSPAEQTARKGFRPRRLGHVNLYVGSIDAAMDFYVNVCGFEDVFREHQIKAGFVSNGRGHHDLGMVERVPRQLIGREGEVLGDREVPDEPGLNHLAFEIDTEADLVDAFKKIVRQPDIPIDMTLDHGLAKSIYLKDPAGNELEFYADSIPDWRTFFNEALAKNAMVTGLWTPGVEVPTHTNYFNENPKIRSVEDALLHPVSVIHATMTVPNFDATLKFYKTFGGFEELPLGIDGVAVLKGYKQRLHDVTLVRGADDERSKIHHITFGMPSMEELDAGMSRIKQARIPIDRRIDTSRKSSFFIHDPDGLLLEFAFYKSTDISGIKGKSRDEAPYLI